MVTWQPLICSASATSTPIFPEPTTSTSRGLVHLYGINIGHRFYHEITCKDQSRYGWNKSPAAGSQDKLIIGYGLPDRLSGVAVPGQYGSHSCPQRIWIPMRL